MKAEDQYLKFVLWNDEDSLYIFSLPLKQMLVGKRFMHPFR